MNVDIIVATYKRYDLLRDALQSVVNQTYPHWKCWVAEDGESQETYDAVKPFLQDNRFVYLPGTHAGFPAVPRNRAIRRGNAPYVAALDDDDLWLPNKLETQVAFMEKNPNCVLLGCNAFCWNSTEDWNKSPLYFNKERLGKISYQKLVEQNYLINSSIIMRRNAVKQSGLYNEGSDLAFIEDYELNLRIGVLGEIWSLPDPYMIYRQTSSKFYSKPDRYANYKIKAGVFKSALKGVEGVQSPLTYPENEHLAVICRRERDFYLAGPRFLGRLRHELPLKIKQFFNFGNK